MMRTPFVMVYRVSPLTYMLGKPRVKVPRFAMVNLIAGEQIVPELVQHDFTAQKVVARLQGNPPRRPRARPHAGGPNPGESHAPRRRKALLETPPQHPADRAAEIILASCP